MTYSWHRTTWDKLDKARAQNHLSHALLLVGEEGIGKYYLAQALVKSLLCFKPNNYRACNNCKGCKTFVSGANPDYLPIELLEGKQQVSVDQIREANQFLNYTTSFNAYRVVLIDQSDRMNRNAANSLLKSLEEPHDNTVIILVSNSLNNLLPTIKSRCQVLNIKSPSREESISWMKERHNKTENTEELLEISNGKPLRAIKISEEVVTQRKNLSNALNLIIKGEISITKTAKDFEKYDRALLIDWQLQWVQSCIKNRTKNDPLLAVISNAYNTSDLWFFYQELINQRKLVHTSVNPLLFVESMLMLWSKN